MSSPLSSIVQIGVAAFLSVFGCCLATDRPIIGIMSQELENPGWRNYTSYLAASYVKAVEASGARVVPVLIRQPPSYYKTMVNSINGLVLPGGDSDFNTPDGIGAAASYIFKLVNKMNSGGDNFPILGVCQGMQLLAHLSNNRTNILVGCDSNNVNLPLNFRDGFRNSSLYSFASQTTIDILSSLPVTSNHHHYCVTEGELKKFGLLDSYWKVLSTNKDSQGLEFVSSMESLDGLFAGVQFHPEKSPYEWSPPQNNPHTPQAVQVSRHFYDWLVRKAIENNHSFPNPQAEMKALIYNVDPLYTDKLGFYNMQTYYYY